mmetsp:Transcript_121114/g.386801  ORF Transcript_121114/g.386801 Transcript_121114/m.386801 type:complete len:271 (+) Transcript_121114:1021-1833(+)
MHLIINFDGQPPLNRDFPSQVFVLFSPSNQQLVALALLGGCEFDHAVVLVQRSLLEERLLLGPLLDSPLQLKFMLGHGLHRRAALLQQIMGLLQVQTGICALLLEAEAIRLQLGTKLHVPFHLCCQLTNIHLLRRNLACEHFVVLHCLSALLTEGVEFGLPCILLCDPLRLLGRLLLGHRRRRVSNAKQLALQPLRQCPESLQMFLQRFRVLLAPLCLQLHRFQPLLQAAILPAAFGKLSPQISKHVLLIISFATRNLAPESHVARATRR